jgi:hypothetical protein
MAEPLREGATGNPTSTSLVVVSLRPGARLGLGRDSASQLPSRNCRALGGAPRIALGSS